VNRNPDISNLKPFKKGQSGNPKGRPKMPNIKKALAKVLSEEKDGMQAVEAVLKALRAKAVKGDVRAAQELFDRAYGKAKQIAEIDHTTNGKDITPPIKWVDGDSE
jgi:hypothetical protein